VVEQKINVSINQEDEISKLNQANLAKFGRTFQLQLLKALIEDREYLLSIVDILNPNFFSNGSFKWICKAISDFVEKYPEDQLTFSALNIERDKIDNDILHQTVTEDISTLVKLKGIKGLASDKFVKDKALDFFRYQNLKDTLNQCVITMMNNQTAMKNEIYDQISSMITQATTAGTRADIGILYDDSLDYCIAKKRNIIPLPWNSLNKCMNGGIGRGELMAIIAGTNVGKSHALNNISANAIMNSFNAVYYTMELSEVNVRFRHDARISGIPINDIPFRREDVLKAIKQKVTGKLIIKEFPMHQITPQTLKVHLGKLIARNLKPDIVIIDYADLMKATHYRENKYYEIGETYELLRGMATEYDVAIITASQANREGASKELLTLEYIAEGFSKAMTSDVIITISSNLEQKAENIGQCFLAKNRAGISGITFPVLLNPAISRIDILDKDDTKMSLLQAVKKKVSNDITNSGVKDALTKYLENK